MMVQMHVGRGEHLQLLSLVLGLHQLLGEIPGGGGRRQR